MNIDPASPLGRKCLQLAGSPASGVAKPTQTRGCPSLRNTVRRADGIHPVGWAVEFTIMLRLANESNTGGPLGAKLGRKAKAKAITRDSLPPLLPPPPVRVTLTRLGGTRRMDGDGWQSATKAVRDIIAEALGVDDGDRDKVTFVYRQRPSYGASRVLVRVESI